MKRLIAVILCIIILLSCGKPGYSNLKSFVNSWHEPIYNETEHGDTLRDSYGGYFCIILKSNGEAYVHSEKFGEEGPFHWCLNEDGSLMIDDNYSIIEYIEDDFWNVEIHNGLITLDGVFSSCYSNPSLEDTGFSGDLSQLYCEE